MEILRKIDPELITGLRDALSHALGVSVTFVDTAGKALHADTAPSSRRMVSDLCKTFHYIEGCPIKKQICDVWDQEAIEALKSQTGTASQTFRKPCGLGFECIAVPIIVGGEMIGAIFGGELRIQGIENKQNTLKTGIKIINSNTSEYEEIDENIYKEIHDKSYQKSKTVTTNEFSQIQNFMEEFAQIFSVFVVKNAWDKNGSAEDAPETSIQAVTKIKTLIQSMTRDNLTDIEKLLSLLSIILVGIPDIHKWKSELLDPAQRNPTDIHPKSEKCYVMFLDIRRFSEITMKTHVSLIENSRKRLFSRIMQQVKINGGVIDNIIGDALLVFFFQLPEDRETAAGSRNWLERVAECALKLENIYEEIPNHGQPGNTELERFELGIGITYGDILYGLFHFDVPDERREFTGLGVFVNKAQRLCQFARRYGKSANNYGYTPAIVIDEGFQQQMQVSQKFRIKHLDRVQLKGFDTENETGDHNIYSFSYKKPDDKDEKTVTKQYIYLSYGMLSSPKNHVVHAFQEYYDAVKQDGHANVELNPHQQVANEVANLINASESNIGFTPNTTHCLTQGVESIIEAVKENASEKETMVFVNTDLDHPSIRNLINIMLDETIKRVTVNLSTQIKIDIRQEVIIDIFVDIIEKIDEDGENNPVVILFIPHISWSTGVRLPYERIVREYKKKYGNNLWVIIDGAHCLGHISLSLNDNVADAAIDFYATCGHKWLGGPHGTGIYWASPRLLASGKVGNRLAALDTLTHDGGIGARVLDLETGRKEQTATSQRAMAHALIRACEIYRGSLSDKGVNSRSEIDNIESEIMGLAGTFLEKLQNWQKNSGGKNCPTFEILSPSSDDIRCGIVSFRIIDVESIGHRDLRNELNRKKIFVTWIDEIFNSALNKQMYGIRVCISNETDEQDLDLLLSEIDEWYKNR